MEQKPTWKKIGNAILPSIAGGAIIWLVITGIFRYDDVQELRQAISEQQADSSEHRRRTARVTETYPWWQARVTELERQNEDLLDEVADLRTELEYQNFLLRSQQGANTKGIQNNAADIRDLSQRVNGNER